MKKKEIARVKNSSEFKGKCEKTIKCLPTNMKRIAFAVVFLTFVLPINNQVFADKEIKPGKKQATLILSNGRKIVLNTCSDSIVNLKTNNIHIKIDSTGIRYITTDNTIKTIPVKSKSVKEKTSHKKRTKTR